MTTTRTQDNGIYLLHVYKVVRLKQRARKPTEAWSKGNVGKKTEQTVDRTD